MVKKILLFLMSGLLFQFAYGMANPASVYCEQNSGTLSITKNLSGGEYGICTFEDNRMCEERAMYNGDCPIGGKKITGYNNESDIYCAIRGNTAIAQDTPGKSGTCILKDLSVCSSEYYYSNNSCSGRNETLEQKAQALCYQTGVQQVDIGMGYIKALFKTNLSIVKYYSQTIDGSFSSFECNLLSSAQIPQLCKDISQMTVNRKNICIENSLINNFDLGSENQELENAISRMNKKGLSKYTNIEDFLPENLITRQEASKFISQFAKIEFSQQENTGNICKFQDIGNADYTLKEYINISCKMGIFKGSNSQFLPFKKLTKAEAITVLMRIKYGMMDETVNPWRKQYFEKIYSIGILSKEWTENNVDQYITRGELALLIYKLHLLN